MRDFKKVNKVFIKSNNTTNKIFNRYLYCLIPFIILLIFYNLIWGTTEELINLLTSISLSIITCSITQYIFNIKKENPISTIYLEDNILTISIILGLFSKKSPILIIIISSLITIIIKNKLKNINLSSTLYGILCIVIYSYLNNLTTPLSNLTNLSYVGTYKEIITPYGNILEYLIVNNYYLSPILSIISFIYLFIKKSIKYNIVFSYIITVSFIMLILGLLNNMNIWYLFFQLTTGNILFLTIFCLTDYPSTPITNIGQIYYGLILGIITSILRFIIPELSVIIPLIIGPLLLTKYINKMSIKLKYNKKLSYLITITSIILVIITTLTINIIRF